MANASYAIDVEAKVSGAANKGARVRRWLAVAIIHLGTRLLRSRVDLEIGAKAIEPSPPAELTPACCPFVYCPAQAECSKAPNKCRHGS